MSRSTYIHGAVLSRTFGRWHALGPALYVQVGDRYLHFYARWFRLPYQHGWYWSFAVRSRRRLRMWSGRP